MFAQHPLKRRGEFNSSKMSVNMCSFDINLPRNCSRVLKYFSRDFTRHARVTLDIVNSNVNKIPSLVNPEYKGVRLSE